MRTLRMKVSPPSANAAFTIVELLVVMAIIGLLVALLFPALSGARIRVLEARVQAEMKDLDGALARFKGLYGVYPPSSITLYETSMGDPSWAAHGMAGSATDVERIRSRELIKNIWPSFDFDTPINLNRDSDTTDGPVTLVGAECLVFFLGGLPEPSMTVPNPNALNSFSTDKAHPFNAGGSREQLLFEFQSIRLIDSNSNGFREYVDTIGGTTSDPYVYASGYEGTKYNDADVAPLTAVYLQADGTTPYNKTTYQLISPGMNRKLGDGGTYDPGDPSTLAGENDRDNLTNFQTGRLAP